MATEIGARKESPAKRKTAKYARGARPGAQPEEVTFVVQRKAARRVAAATRAVAGTGKERKFSPVQGAVKGEVWFRDGQLWVADDALARAIAQHLGHIRRGTTQVHSARIVTIRHSEPEVIVDGPC
jgi:hypothetical protein